MTKSSTEVDIREALGSQSVSSVLVDIFQAETGQLGLVEEPSLKAEEIAFSTNKLDPLEATLDGIL